MMSVGSIYNKLQICHRQFPVSRGLSIQNLYGVHFHAPGNKDFSEKNLKILNQREQADRYLCVVTKFSSR